MSDDPSNSRRQREVASFVRRKGRITPAQQRALDELAPQLAPPAGDDPVDFDAWFGRSGPVLVEIGFGNGEALSEFAQANPDWNCVGVEVYPPGVGALLNSVDRAGLTNVRVVQEDAVLFLRARVSLGALSQVHIFFPDPWHKKRHNKRRLVKSEFVAMLSERLKGDGQLCLATDWAPYAEQMVEVLDGEPSLINTCDGYAPRPAGRPLTRFERRGERLGHEVFDLVYRRR